jgi:pantoate--beta-alanine ligase
MKLITDVKKMQSICNDLRSTKKTIGFVPTMGALHQGHITLIEAARQNNDIVIVSIFVNPIQFGPKEDFAQYPRNLKADLEICERLRVDFVFHPEERDMYPKDFDTFVEVPQFSKKLCGRFRPSHFRGVTTIVVKLFNIIKPSIAYFGQKDYQQALIIQKMVRDLNYDIRIEMLPIVRDSKGLALSSRNQYLSEDEYKASLNLSQSLNQAKDLINNGELDGLKIIEYIITHIKKEPLIKIEYVEVCDPKTLMPIKKIEDEALIAIAARVGRARLIDNILIRR